MKKFILSGATIVALGLGAAATPAHAITVSLSPTAQTATVGSLFDIQVQISGLLAADPNQVLSSYGIGVAFDPTLFSATSIDFGNLLGGGTGDSLTFFDWDTTAGLFTLNEVSLLGDNDLKLLQSDSFTLATLHFTAISEGLSSLSISNISLAGQTPAGSNPQSLDAQTLGAEVTNQPRQSVSEPSILALMGAGFLITGFSRRKKMQFH